MVGISLKKNLLRERDQIVLIEPSLLFQCLFTVSKRLKWDRESSLKYEFFSYHVLLIDDSGMLQKPIRASKKSSNFQKLMLMG